MPASSTYQTSFVRTRRGIVAAQLRGYDGVMISASADPAIVFEPLYFHGLTFQLDYAFVNRRLLGDGGPADEVRVLAVSLLDHEGVFTVPDELAAVTPERSVLGYAAGDRISIHREEFERLAVAYFDSIEADFSS